MSVINTKQYTSELMLIAQSYDFPVEDIIVVPSIIDYCNERNISEDNPFAIGKVIQNRETKKYKILLVAEIDQDCIDNSIIPAMNIRGFYKEAEELNNPESFLKHLVLHEIAHAKNNHWSEAQSMSQG